MSLRRGLLMVAVLAILVGAVGASAQPANDGPLAAEPVDGCTTQVFASTSGATNQVDDLNCANTGGAVIQPYGGDVFYEVTVPWSYDLHLLVEPLGDWDVSLYVITSPWNPDQTCLVASDVAGNGIAEMVSLQNDHVSEEPRTYIIGVDSWRADQSGDFRLSLTCDFAVPVTEPTFSTLKSRFRGDGR